MSISDKMIEIKKRNKLTLIENNFNSYQIYKIEGITKKNGEKFNAT